MSADSDKAEEARTYCSHGASFAATHVLPSLRHLAHLEHAQRAQVYAGLLGAIIGYMSSDLGPDDAEAVFHGFDGAFDEARRIREQIAKGLN